MGAEREPNDGPRAGGGVLEGDEHASLHDTVLWATPGSAAPSQPTAQVGRFVTVGVTGAGGMGRVFESKEPALDRSVAVKLLRDEDAMHDGLR